MDVHDLTGKVELSLRFIGIAVDSLDLALQVQHNFVGVLLPEALSGWNLDQAYQFTDYIFAVAT